MINVFWCTVPLNTFFPYRKLNHFRKRMKIYRFMLEHMTDEHKFNLSAKLTNDASLLFLVSFCTRRPRFVLPRYLFLMSFDVFFSVKQVLGAIVDGVIPLDSETSALLQDTLTILCCKVRYIYCKIFWLHNNSVFGSFADSRWAYAIMNCPSCVVVGVVVVIICGQSSC